MREPRGEEIAFLSTLLDSRSSKRLLMFPSYPQKESIMLNVTHILPSSAFIFLLVLIELYVWCSIPLRIHCVLCFSSPDPLSKVSSCTLTI